MGGEVVIVGAVHAFPSSWLGVDTSLALAAFVITVYACVCSVFGGTTSRISLPNC